MHTQANILIVAGQWPYHIIIYYTYIQFVVGSLQSPVIAQDLPSTRKPNLIDPGLWSTGIVQVSWTVSATPS
jgi:hypothetical protein